MVPQVSAEDDVSVWIECIHPGALNATEVVFHEFDNPAFELLTFTVHIREVHIAFGNDDANPVPRVLLHA